jgi:hypothetical protein
LVQRLVFGFDLADAARSVLLVTTMDEVKRKVYLDLFASPYNLIPFAAGLTSLMASWAIGGDLTLTMAGIAGVLGGIGVTASRLMCLIEGLT